MTIAVLGAGAFGTALAIALARDDTGVGLWARDPDQVAVMRDTRRNDRRLPGALLPKSVSISANIADFAAARTLLLAMPMQQMAGFLATHGAALDAHALIACSKGIELATGRGPSRIIAEACPRAIPAVLTGPSFAADIARGLPTALTLACADDRIGATLQAQLSNSVLRLYRTHDVTGAELGGALKNVIAISAGIVMGAGLGDSARAALMTRGFAEMNRLAQALGAGPDTLSGLSGLGDLVLTCTSPQSRNYRHGFALGADAPPEPGATVEGIATARAASTLAAKHLIDVPVTDMVAALTDGKITVAAAIEALMARPLKKE